MYKEDIIDAHMHLWDLDHGKYPWLSEGKGHFEEEIGNYDKIKKNFLITDYETFIKPHPVVKSVHVEANPDPKRGLYETEWLQKIADHHGYPHGIVAFADLTDPDIANVLKDHCQFPNVRGIRQILFHEPKSKERDLIKDPHFFRGLKALEKQMLSFDLALFGHQIPDVISLVKKIPKVPFILDHLGWPRDLSDEGFASWKYDIARLADNDNAHLKLSGIGLIFQVDDRENIERFLHAGIEIFGEDRCLFASNVPPDTLFFSYDKIIEIFKKVFSRYEMSVQRKLFYENAKEFYDL